MVEIIGKLQPEDLTRIRVVRAKKLAVERNPNAYSARETEQAILDDMRAIGEICQNYGIDGTRAFVIQQFTGDLYYDE